MRLYGKPEIFNTDQGSQFTSTEFTSRLQDADVQISMDSRGRCMYNILIERLWRSMKYEAVYLVEMTDGFHAERVIGEWIEFYNAVRPHLSIGGATPDEAYRASRPVMSGMRWGGGSLPESAQASLRERRPVYMV